MRLQNYCSTKHSEQLNNAMTQCTLPIPTHADMSALCVRLPLCPTHTWIMVGIGFLHTVSLVDIMTFVCPFPHSILLPSHSFSPLFHCIWYPPLTLAYAVHITASKQFQFISQYSLPELHCLWNTSLKFQQTETSSTESRTASRRYSKIYNQHHMQCIMKVTLPGWFDCTFMHCVLWTALLATLSAQLFVVTLIVFYSLSQCCHVVLMVWHCTTMLCVSVCPWCTSGNSVGLLWFGVTILFELHRFTFTSWW